MYIFYIFFRRPYDTSEIALNFWQILDFRLQKSMRRDVPQMKNGLVRYCHPLAMFKLWEQRSLDHTQLHSPKNGRQIKYVEELN